MRNPNSPTRCKPGDRAKIVQASCPQNIGLVVFVIRRYQAPERIDGVIWESDGVSWVIASSYGQIASLNLVDGSLSLSSVAVLDDVDLVPIDNIFSIKKRAHGKCRRNPAKQNKDLAAI